MDRIEDLAMVIALIVTIIAVLAAVLVFRRTRSLPLRVLAILTVPVIAMGALAFASLGTIAPEVRMAMDALRSQEPTRTILATDRTMEARLHDAVVKGIIAPRTGGRTRSQNLNETVNEVLTPYVAERMKHASDTVVTLFARDTLASFIRARDGGGTSACAGLLTGDQASERYAPRAQDARWTGLLLQDPQVDEPRVAGTSEKAQLVAAVAMGRGWLPVQVVAAFRGVGPLTCDVPIAMLEGALSRPSGDAAALIRGMGFTRMIPTAK